jgi:hypothetical protein
MSTIESINQSVNRIYFNRVWGSRESLRQTACHPWGTLEAKPAGHLEDPLFWHVRSSRRHPREHHAIRWCWCDWMLGCPQGKARERECRTGEWWLQIETVRRDEVTGTELALEGSDIQARSVHLVALPVWGLRSFERLHGFGALGHRRLKSSIADTQLGI